MSFPRELQERLTRLRDRFIGEASTGGDYWDSEETLAAYDATFGERIGWKWDAVLAELALRSWKPPAGTVLVDFGCGSGVAVQRVVAAFGATHFSAVHLGDLSPLATSFASRKLRERFPALEVRTATPAPQIPEGPFTLIVSHVINELNPAERAALLRIAERAAATIWVEPGTSDAAGMLVVIREALRETMRVIAPCTHGAPCGLQTPENARHWCHHFARPPTVAFTESFWAEFGRALSIDMRSLPYSFLVLDAQRSEAATPAGVSRVIGQPREYKGFSRLLVCSAEGVADRILQKRDDPALFKELDRTRRPFLYRFEFDDEHVRSGTQWPPPDPDRDTRSQTASPVP
ncbi:MAG TPA: small ribosomal subunit Rsm22 family protein [Opitutaceae bacterium]|nr:small ribosomal subunit Rsm22 family protein [Opitutaceae bacterium]